jgi:hypothetical protein
MEKPNIEKEIKKQGNIIAGVGAFLGLGATAISAATASPLTTLMLCGAMTPFFIDIITLKFLIEKPKILHHDIWFLDKPFKKNINKWISKYLDNSQNLTEKKYKVGCLSLWMRHEGINVNKIMNTGIFKKLSEELVIKEEVEKYIPLQYLFGEQRDSIKNIFGVDPSVQTFLEYDKNEPYKLEIAKNVYKEYSKIGMAAGAFLNRTNFEELLILQDYKFTKEDYSTIKVYLENFKNDGEKHPIEFQTMKLYSPETEEILIKLIENENNIDHLEILNRYCSEILAKSRLEQFSKVIDKKIDYIELNGQLESKDNVAITKVKKIKI